MAEFRTVVIDQVMIAVTNFTRAEIGSLRAALKLPILQNLIKEDIAIDADDEVNYDGGVISFLAIATEANTIEVELVRGAGTITLPVKQCLFLTGDLTEFTIKNTLAEGDPARVRVIYS